MKEINKSVVQTFADKLLDLVSMTFGVDTKSEPTVEVTKALDVEQRRAMFVVLEPDIIDLHGDTYSCEEVEKACINFNTHCNKANLFHRVQTEHVKIEQSFINPSSFVSDDGREIKKGTWLQWWYFPEDDSNSELLWKMVKDGEIQGVSIGATAMVYDIE